MSGIRPGDGDARHGTLNGYSNLRCRCQPCRDAFAAYQRKRRVERAQILASDPRRGLHGQANTYTNYGCRCRDCKDAHADKMWRYAQRRRTEAAS